MNLKLSEVLVYRTCIVFIFISVSSKFSSANVSAQLEHKSVFSRLCRHFQADQAGLSYRDDYFDAEPGPFKRTQLGDAPRPKEALEVAKEVAKRGRRKIRE